MWTAIADFFGAERYSQHSICLTNDPLMIGAYTIGDLVIWLSYTVIAGALVICRRRGITPRPLAFDLFASFIVLCGLSHLVKTVTLYTGVYRLDVLVVIATAGISAVSAWYTLVSMIDARDT